MKNLASDILKRIKRLWILLIVLPLLTGVISYYLEAREQTSYTAEVTISLGNFQNDSYTNLSWVTEHFKHEDLLTKVLSNSNSNLEIDTVMEKLKAETDGNKFVKLSVTSVNEDEAKNILNAVVDGFLAVSKKVWEEKYNSTLKSIKGIESLDSAEISAEGYKDFDELRQTQIDYENGKTEISDSISITPNYINPPKRAIFGVLIGIMLNILIVFLPELFRSDTKR
jgi:teichuronic acid biosynthesis protein TuaF